MASIKVTEIAYVRLRAPDLGLAEEFLTHFGLRKAERTPSALYMRASDSSHHVYVVEKGEPRFLGFAYFAASEADLRLIGGTAGSALEHLDEPGGGKRVRLTEPNGYTIEVVQGMANVDPIPVDRLPMNTGSEPLRRAGVLNRPSPAPTPVKRIAHVVMASPKVNETAQWFRDKLGLLSSDEVYMGTSENIIGSFNRCDRGDEYVDHHSLFVIFNPKAGLNHVSFEVPDVDAVFLDHDYLKKLGRYEHFWGIGRHLLGSQIFDYWIDPWGRMHEHWADTDRLQAKAPSKLWPAQEGLAVMWGPHPPERIKNQVSP
jgi:catechol 2,3-dioxygenase-like lactoylglutathione lyase family enzyme